MTTYPKSELREGVKDIQHKNAWVNFCKIDNNFSPHIIRTYSHPEKIDAAFI